MALISRAASDTGLVPRSHRVLEALDRGLELNPGLLAGGDETAVGVQPGDTLEGDPEQSGVVESQAPDGFGPDGDEIGGGVVALGQAIDLVVEVLERGLGDRGDEALLRSEQAVDGPRGRARLGCCRAHRQRVGTACCDEPLGRRP